MAANRVTIKLSLNDCRVEMALDQALTPSQQMTGLLYAVDQMKELSKISDFQLMFDADNPTTAEEILQQGITDVLLLPKNVADRVRT